MIIVTMTFLNKKMKVTYCFSFRLNANLFTNQIIDVRIDLLCFVSNTANIFGQKMRLNFDI